MFYCCFSNKYVNNYFVFDRSGGIKITCERLSDKMYNAISPIRDEVYLKSELHFQINKYIQQLFFTLLHIMIIYHKLIHTVIIYFNQYIQ